MSGERAARRRQHARPNNRALTERALGTLDGREVIDAMSGADGSVLALDAELHETSA